MASPQQPTTIQNLPGELLSEILIRIPAKPLAQLRCVSKPWNALLSKPSFIKSNLHRSSNDNDEILLLLSDGGLCVPFSVTTHFCLSPHLDLTNFIKLPAISPSESETVKFIGSINGLICFSFQSDDDNHFTRSYHKDMVIQIWNPSLSTVLTLRPCQLSNWDFDFDTSIYFRFGYDPKMDDYKLVKFISISQEWLQVELFSLRKDSWELITQKLPSHVIIIYNNDDEGCVDGCNGRLHWLGTIDKRRKLQTIVAFDLGMETFSEISLPESVIDHDEPWWAYSLGVMAGKLCVISHNTNLECEIWVMNEYGVAESWVKHNVLSELSGVLIPYGFTLSNKFLFATFGDWFCSYDPISANTEKIARGNGYRPVKVVRYVESLVWIAPVRSSCSKQGSLQT